MTPLQKKVFDCVVKYESKHAVSLSGRELSLQLGKSRNHMSQIMNDGLVPSGDALVKFAEHLGCGDKETRDLLLAAMQTKAETRTRDGFWLSHALEFTSGLNDRVDLFIAYLESIGKLKDFERWSKTSKAKKAAAKVAKAAAAASET